MSLHPETSSTTRDTGDVPDNATSSKRVASHDIFGNARLVIINHAGEEYRLSITANGRLILTK